MNIRDCEYLIAVDELKSFIQASKKCFISQPALSQQIKKIESQIGFNIFERTNKSVITSRQGEKVIRYAKEIVQNYKNIKNIGQNKKEIKIAFIPTICPYLLPHIVEDLNQNLTNTKFYFLEQKTDALINSLKSGDIDMGVIAYFADLIDDKLNYQKLYDEDFVLVLPKNSELTAEDLPQIMQDKQLILLEEGNCISDNIRDICSVYSYDSFNDFFATNIETIKNMIRIDNGTGLLPKLACLDEKNLKILPFSSKKQREVGILYRKNFDNISLINQITCIIQATSHKLLD